MPNLPLATFRSIAQHGHAVGVPTHPDISVRHRLRGLGVDKGSQHRSARLLDQDIDDDAAAQENLADDATRYRIR